MYRLQAIDIILMVFFFSLISFIFGASANGSRSFSEGYNNGICDQRCFVDGFPEGELVNEVCVCISRTQPNTQEVNDDSL